ncbi:hypothetical protein [uncultured Piscinibacter sp.]|uniref:hypothetical protein n=1 Tax=uncultured Piscinibacter sp. TaxID=1131835 RepID=UPI0026276052|nr:hypothetical protein [uncultured Piscinibacter sp.]
MIHVLEMPEGAAPRAWFAFDADDLLRKLAGSQAAELHAQGRCRMFADESAALAAFERADDPAWQGDGWRARWALREQLVALEVLADDL